MSVCVVNLELVQNGTTRTVLWPHANQLDQSYRRIQGAVLRRTINGGAIKITHWGKVQTTVNGLSRLDQPFWDLDDSQPLTLRCSAPMSLQDTGVVFTLPTARRADIAPLGFGIVNGDVKQQTNANLVGDTLTLTTVPGATHYQAMYWPELSVFITLPEVNFDRNAGAWRWSLLAEEL